MAGIATRVVHPADCALAFAFPLGRARFEADRQPGGDKEFALRFRAYSDYYDQIVRPYERTVRPALEPLGVHIATDVTLPQFRRLFDDGAPAVVILFAHWRDETDQVELADGMVGAEALALAVPEQFDGIVDLCVCHPRALARALEARRPGCLVKRIDVEATPILWMSFYVLLLRALGARGLTYFQGLELAKSLLEQRLRPRRRLRR
jgi:hypothetical protein